MNGEQYIVPVRIAGLNFVIITRFKRNADYFREYQIAEADVKTPVIEIPFEQIDISRKTFAEKFDPQLASYSDECIERILIHTQLAEYAVTKDVLLMHGSALQMDGRCYIFTARSGTGKSTHARLWREVFGDKVSMVNDDKPLLICKQEGITVCGTPWMGKHQLGENTAVPLKAIAFLHRAEKNSVEPVSPELAFRYLYTQVYRPLTATGQKKALALVARICKNVSFYHLYCNMEPEAALVSFEGMQ